MKKIKIITFCSALCNYGQVLQAYSLQRYLRDNYKEFETKLIYAHPFGATQKPSKKSCVKIFLEHLTTARRYFNAYILCLDKYDKKIRAIKMEMIKEAMREVLSESPNFTTHKARINMLNKKREFERFKRGHIAIHCDDLQNFSRFAPEYEADCYIVGSDQVWNVGSDNFWADFYTLEFLPPNHKSKKISYAASLGKAEFGSEGEKAYFKKALAKFDAISVRESCNIKTLNEIGFKAECVPDPTQLLTKSDYEKLIDSSIEKRRDRFGKKRWKSAQRKHFCLYARQ